MKPSHCEMCGPDQCDDCRAKDARRLSPLPRGEGQGEGQTGTWITDQLPDTDLTVLMRLNDQESPIWPGFHDGEQWRSADATLVCGPVLGWLELEDAAKTLDRP